MLKLIKWSFYTVAVIMVAGMFLSDPHEDSVFAGPTQEELALKAELKAEKEAKIKAEKEAEAKAKEEKAAKLAAYKASPEGKTEAWMSNVATGACMKAIKRSAKFPNKVDFDWFGGNVNKFYMNFNENGDSRIMVVRTGEMMNGLGMMVPFKGVCKFDYNPTTEKGKIIEFLL